MALQQEIALPIAGGFVAPEAYIKIGKTSQDHVEGRVDCVVYIYRDKETRVAHSEAFTALKKAYKEAEEATRVYNEAQNLEVTDEASQRTKVVTFISADDRLKAARKSLDEAYAVAESPAIKPFREYTFVVPESEVTTNGAPDLAKLYDHAKAVLADLAEAKNV